MSKTLFEKIIDREVPATIVYEDDLVLAFRDIKPQAPTHVLVIPKKPIPRIAEAKPEDHKVLGHLLLKAAEVANQLGLTQSGSRLVFNNGPDAGEAVPHLHCHIIGGRKMLWPPGLGAVVSDWCLVGPWLVKDERDAMIPLPAIGHELRAKRAR